jgi:mobile mystery protein B
MFNQEPDGATPLSPDDLLGLRYKHIDTRAQLNNLEAANIIQGQLWARNLKNQTLDTILDRDFVVNLHRALFGEVWIWAGNFRQRELNVGVEPIKIPVVLHNFLADAKCWIEYKHFDNLELSARIQHRMVQIHPFVNGNGRHARIFTNIVRTTLLGEKPMKWANVKLDGMTKERALYISVLRKADGGDFSAFITYLKDLGN